MKLSIGFNPLHCGAVVASRARGRLGAGRAARFNPLHCGAVVASFGVHEWKYDIHPCFNPLHCGAVVASESDAQALVQRLRVSIPFIAGQWSLRAAVHAGSARTEKFQSPSLRGSGRFPDKGKSRDSGEAGFNPLHCGAVVASSGCRRPRLSRGRSVSIPFIAGQWSLRLAVALTSAGTATFQSPSLRGSGRFV